MNTSHMMAADGPQRPVASRTNVITPLENHTPAHSGRRAGGHYALILMSFLASAGS